MAAPSYRLLVVDDSKRDTLLLERILQQANDGSGQQTSDRAAASDGKENHDHEHLHDPGSLTFWPKQMLQESADTVRLDRPDEPHHEENGRHRSRHVQIGVTAAKERSVDHEVS